jgi:hypothetical protein
MVTKSRDNALTELRSLLAGLKNNSTSHASTLAGQTCTEAELIARVQVSIDAEAKVQTLKNDLHPS